MQGLGKMLAFLTLFLLCKAAAAKISKDSQDSPKTALNITKVFDTKNRLWLYQQTNPNVFIDEEYGTGAQFAQNCTFIKKINISSTSIYFWKKMDFNGELVTNLLRGDLILDGKKPPKSMKVSELSGDGHSEFLTVTLGYSNRGCNVFLLTYAEDDEEGEEASSSLSECEMYIRINSGANLPPDNECRKFYRKNCRSGGPILYKKSCEKMPKSKGN